MDSNMSLTPHINQIAVFYSIIIKAVFYQLHNIRRNRKYLLLDATKVSAHVFVAKRIDYCNSLLYGAIC